jgi:hypothetical protein
MTCTHHWLCEPGTVLNCPAVCKHCGAERVFPNASTSVTNPSVSRTAGSLSGAGAYSGYGLMSRGSQN